MRTSTPAADVTVRDLLAHPALSGADVAGGAAGLGAVVRSVVVASRPAPSEPGALVVLVTGPESTGLDADIALRLAADHRAAAVLLPGSLRAPTTTRIADRLAIPAIVHDAADPHRLAHALEALVLAPRMAQAETLLAAARAIRDAGADVDGRDLRAVSPARDADRDRRRGWLRDRRRGHGPPGRAPGPRDPHAAGRRRPAHRGTADA